MFPAVSPATLLLATLALSALSGCSTPHQVASTAPTTASSDVAGHTDTQYGFRIAIPPGVTPRPDFATSYLANEDWKAYAGPDSHGVPRLAMALPGSNRITTAELRIGVSGEAREVRRCTQPPQGVAGKPETVTINGVDYTRFNAQDAAMSHYLVVEAYRAVHAGRCYALDLMVYGVNPQVYSPPATAPFSQAQALRQLRTWLGGFAFLP